MNRKHSAKGDSQSLAPLYWAMGIAGAMMLGGIGFIVAALLNGQENQPVQVARNSGEADDNQKTAGGQDRSESRQRDQKDRPDGLPGTVSEKSSAVKNGEQGSFFKPVSDDEAKSLIDEPKPKPVVIDPRIPKEFNVSWAGKEMNIPIVVPENEFKQTRLCGDGSFLLLIGEDSFDVFDIEQAKVLHTIKVKTGTELAGGFTKVAGYHEESKQLSLWDLATGELEKQEPCDLDEPDLFFLKTPDSRLNFILTNNGAAFDVDIETLQCEKIPFDFTELYASSRARQIIAAGYRTITKRDGRWKQTGSRTHPGGAYSISSSGYTKSNRKGMYDISGKQFFRFDGVFDVIHGYSSNYYLHWPDPTVGDQKKTMVPYLRNYRFLPFAVNVEFLAAKALDRYVIPKINKIVDIVPGGIRCVPFEFSFSSPRIRGLRTNISVVKTGIDRTEETEFEPYKAEVSDGVIKLPAPYTQAAIGKSGSLLFFYHPELKKISALDTDTYTFVASIDTSDDMQMVASGRRLIVFDRANKKIESWNFKDFKFENSREWRSAFPVEIACGSSGWGPILARFEPKPGDEFIPFKFFNTDTLDTDQYQFNFQFTPPNNITETKLQIPVKRSEPAKLSVSPGGREFSIYKTHLVRASTSQFIGDVKWNELPGIDIPISGSEWISDRGSSRPKFRGRDPGYIPDFKNARVLAPAEGREYLAFLIPARYSKRTKAADPAVANEKVTINEMAVYELSKDKPKKLLDKVNIETYVKDINDMSDRMFFLPKQKVVVSSSLDKSELRIHRLEEKPKTTITKATLKLPTNFQPYIPAKVTTLDDQNVDPGAGFEYKLEKPGEGTTFKIQKGPIDMRVDSNGLVTWNAPARGGQLVEVAVKVTGKDASKIFAWKLYVDQEEYKRLNQRNRAKLITDAEMIEERFSVLESAEEAGLTTLDKRITSLRMPGRKFTHAVGGAGRYICIHFQELKRIAVFDVARNRVKGYIQIGDEPIKFTAGLEKLLVVQLESSRVTKWDLETLEKELSKRLPENFGISGIFMGSGSLGPAFIYPSHILKLNRLTTSRLTADGRKIFGIDKSTVVSTDGKYVKDPDDFYAFNGKEFQRSRKSPSQLAKMIDSLPVEMRKMFLRSSYLSRDREIAYFDRSGVLFDVYKVSDTISVFDVGRTPPIDVLTILKSSKSKIPLPVFVIPSLNKLIEFSGENVMNCVTLDVEKAIDGSKFSKLQVYSRPYPSALPGEEFEYQILATNVGAGTTYKLKSSPPEMTISKSGLISWPVPSSFYRAAKVTVEVANPDGQTAKHVFSLVPASKRDGDGDAKSDSPKSTPPTGEKIKSDSSTGKSSDMGKPTPSIQQVKKDFYSRLKQAKEQAASSTPSPYELPLRKWSLADGGKSLTARFYGMKNNEVVIFKDADNEIHRINLLDLTSKDMVEATKSAKRIQTVPGVPKDYKTAEDLINDKALVAKIYDDLATIFRRIETENPDDYLLDIIHPHGIQQMADSEVDSFRNKSILTKLYSFEFKDIATFTSASILFEDQKIGLIFSDGRWQLHGAPDSVLKLRQYSRRIKR